MITTLASIGDESVANSNAVLARMRGFRTNDEKVMEYFGITKDDFRNTKKLKQAGVQHTKRLEELGISKEIFEKMFEDVLDFNTTTNGNTTTTANSSNGPETEPELPTDKKRAGRPKK
jgi:hypothetical protein